jgi:hypothetical protein
VIRFKKENPAMSQNMICAQRLYLTADKSALVGDGDARAATLYATPGDEIPASAAEEFGLVDGKLPVKKAKKPAAKSKQTPENKEQVTPENKGGAAADDKSEGEPEGEAKTGDAA